MASEASLHVSKSLVLFQGQQSLKVLTGKKRLSEGRRTCFTRMGKENEQAQPQLYGTSYFSVSYLDLMTQDQLGSRFT